MLNSILLTNERINKIYLAILAVLRSEWSNRPVRGFGPDWGNKIQTFQGWVLPPLKSHPIHLCGNLPVHLVPLIPRTTWSSQIRRWHRSKINIKNQPTVSSHPPPLYSSPMEWRHHQVCNNIVYHLHDASANLCAMPYRWGNWRKWML